MANHASAIKRNRQSEKRAEYNRWWKSRVRTSTKNVLEAVETNSADSAKTLLTEAMKEFGKAAGKGVIHKKTASRKIARLSKKVASLSA